MVGDQHSGMSLDSHAMTERNNQKDSVCLDFKRVVQEASLAWFTSGQIASHGSQIPKFPFPESRK